MAKTAAPIISIKDISLQTTNFRIEGLCTSKDNVRKINNLSFFKFCLMDQNGDSIQVSATGTAADEASIKVKVGAGYTILINKVMANKDKGKFDTTGHAYEVEIPSWKNVKPKRDFEVCQFNLQAVLPINLIKMDERANARADLLGIVEKVYNIEKVQAVDGLNDQRSDMRSRDIGLIDETGYMKMVLFNGDTELIKSTDIGKVIAIQQGKVWKKEGSFFINCGRRIQWMKDEPRAMALRAFAAAR